MILDIVVFKLTLLLLTLIKLLNALQNEIEVKVSGHYPNINDSEVVVNGTRDEYKFLFQSHSHYICHNLSCLEETVKFQDFENKICLFWVSSNIQNDVYTEVYFGWIQYLFSLSNVYKIVLDFQLDSPPSSEFSDVIPPTDLPMREVNIVLELALSLLPTKSIIVTIMGSEIQLLPSKAIELRRDLNKSDCILLHLGHEQPWIEDSNVTNLNVNFGTNDELIKSYAMYKAVFRHYYYEPFLFPNDVVESNYSNTSAKMTNSSCVFHHHDAPLTSLSCTPLVSNVHYIPLGPLYYSFKLGGLRTRKQQMKPFIDKTSLCFVAGRFSYRDSSVFHSDRVEITQLLQNKSFMCDVYMGSPQALAYVDYIALLNNTIFAPCPSGNNPETFRQYEALELGAIPILINRTHTIPQIVQNMRISKLSSQVSNHNHINCLNNNRIDSMYCSDSKISDDDAVRAESRKYRDFLHSDLWKSYPGPILESWSELNPFLTKMIQNLSMAIEFHEKTQIWYKQAKQNMLMDIKRVIDHTYYY